MMDDDDAKPIGPTMEDMANGSTQRPGSPKRSSALSRIAILGLMETPSDAAPSSDGADTMDPKGTRPPVFTIRHEDIDTVIKLLQSVHGANMAYAAMRRRAHSRTEDEEIVAKMHRADDDLLEWYGIEVEAPWGVNKPIRSPKRPPNEDGKGSRAAAETCTPHRHP